MGGRDEVVRLTGSDEEVIAVARAAARAVTEHEDLRREVFPAMSGLRRDRRAYLDAEVTARPPEPRVTGASAWRFVWGALLTVALSATTVSLAMFGPSGRKNRFIDPELAVGAGMPALWIALAAGLVVLIVPIPRGQAARLGTVVTVLVGLMLAAVYGFRLVFGVADDRGFSEAQLVPWLVGGAALLLVLGLLAWRLDRRRRASRGERDPQVGLRRRMRREERRRLLKRATELAATQPGSAQARAELADDWAERLDRLAGQGVNPDTLAQARTLAPSAWLAWTYYDGDLDTDGIMPARYGR